MPTKTGSGCRDVIAVDVQDPAHGGNDPAEPEGRNPEALRKSCAGELPTPLIESLENGSDALLCKSGPGSLLALCAEELGLEEAIDPGGLRGRGDRLYEQVSGLALPRRSAGNRRCLLLGLGGRTLLPPPLPPERGLGCSLAPAFEPRC